MEQPTQQTTRLNRENLKTLLHDQWQQGEHVGVFGPTGAGKTWLVSDVSDVRSYVVVLAVKRYDETVHRFIKAGYKKISKWPPDYGVNRVVLWITPKSLTPDKLQAVKVHMALNDIYTAGGWTLVFDDAGYISSQLGLYKDIGVILNQGRSSYLSCVVVSTQVKSMVGRLPTETLKQIRHRFVFRVRYEDELKAIAAICGVNWRTMQGYMEQLTSVGECLYIGKDHNVYIVERS